MAFIVNSLKRKKNKLATHLNDLSASKRNLADDEAQEPSYDITSKTSGKGPRSSVILLATSEANPFPLANPWSFTGQTVVNPLFKESPEPVRKPSAQQTPLSVAPNGRAASMSQAKAIPAQLAPPKYKQSNEKYPGSQVSAVLFGRKGWDVGISDYTPQMYIAPSALGPNTDPPVVVMTKAVNFPFNVIDSTGTVVVDRTSFLGKYDVVNGFPRNPTGRTGYGGRGLLSRWGPNHAADPIITRWALNASGHFILRGGKRILEVMLLKRKNDGKYILPGNFIDTINPIPVSVITAMRRALDALPFKQEAQRAQIRELISAVLGNGKVIYQGYIDDKRNTDNAWIESEVCNYHDESNKALCWLEFVDKASEPLCYEWVGVSQKLQLPSLQLQWLQKVANNLSADFSAELAPKSTNVISLDSLLPLAFSSSSQSETASSTTTTATTASGIVGLKPVTQNTTMAKSKFSDVKGVRPFGTPSVLTKVAEIKAPNLKPTSETEITQPTTITTSATATNDSVKSLPQEPFSVAVDVAGIRGNLRPAQVPSSSPRPVIDEVAATEELVNRTRQGLRSVENAPVPNPVMPKTIEQPTGTRAFATIAVPTTKEPPPPPRSTSVIARKESRPPVDVVRNNSPPPKPEELNVWELPVDNIWKKQEKVKPAPQSAPLSRPDAASKVQAERDSRHAAYKAAEEKALAENAERVKMDELREKLRAEQARANREPRGFESQNESKLTSQDNNNDTASDAKPELFNDAPFKSSFITKNEEEITTGETPFERAPSSSRKSETLVPTPFLVALRKRDSMEVGDGEADNAFDTAIPTAPPLPTASDLNSLTRRNKSSGDAHDQTESASSSLANSINPAAASLAAILMSSTAGSLPRRSGAENEDAPASSTKSPRHSNPPSASAMGNVLSELKKKQSFENRNTDGEAENANQ